MKAEKVMSTIRVETFGGAASQYPDGPQYVHYVNRADVQTLAVGLGAGDDHRQHRAGKGAVFVPFRQFHLNPHVAHDFPYSYLPHRIGFDEARLR